MLETHLRQAATVLLETTIRIAPQEARDWGQGMLGELSYVEGPWAVAMWALGSASVLARSALISFFFPGRRGQNLVPDGGLFARSFPLRKVVLVVCAVFVAGALLFFLAPPFRQGARISLAAWRDFVRVEAPQSQRRLVALAQRAESNRDAEGLAFAATQLQISSESARLAERAVRLDPNLTWIYFVVAAGHPSLPEIPRWVLELERWDPQNALVHLILAESIHLDRLSRASQLPPGEAQHVLDLESDPAWHNAMAAVFASPKYDDYLDRLRELDRRVFARYGLNNPYEMILGESVWLPAYGMADTQRFAQSLLVSGELLETGGDRKGAREKYWTVARFGQAMDAQAHTGQERMLSASLQSAAYARLKVLSEKAGNADETAHFGYLATKFEPQSVTRASSHEERVFGWNVSARNAAVLQIASLLGLISTGVMAIAAIVLIVASRKGARPGAQRSKSIATGAMLAGSVGFLLSTATIYLTYRPYWYIFQHEILNGDRSRAGDLSDFMWAAHWGPGAEFYGLSATSLPLYFWMGVILLSAFGLVLIFLRHVLGRPRADTTS